MNAKTIELHLLQSFPPSCVNRDGNNSPKDCTFGDVRRARISSQCLKRAIRQADSFAEAVDDEVATRSKQMRDRKLIPYLLDKGLDTDAAEKAADAFRREIAKDDKKANQTSVGLYFGDAELFALLDAHRSGDAKWRDKGARKSADVALFGRMLTKGQGLCVDAAAQVAHGISTHKLSQEMDYWSAADDLKTGADDDAGAGMLGTAEFNASVFYRYACVSLPQLVANLSGDEEMARKTVQGFLLASWDAIPTGKLNGHAHFNPPLVALTVVRRRGMPLSLANAFLQPARATAARDVATASAEALFAHLKAMRQLSPVDEADYSCAHALGEIDTAGVPVLDGYAKLVSAVAEAI